MSNLTNPIAGAGEAAAAYTTAILEMLGDRDPLTVLRGTPARVRASLTGLDDDRVRRPEAPGKWSPIEILFHLADAEVAFAWRLRMVLAQDRPALTGFDQDAWVTGLRYREGRVEDGLQQFEVLRAGHVRLLEGADEATLARVGVHDERGDESVAHMMKMYAGHDLAHLRQLDRVLG